MAYPMFSATGVSTVIFTRGNVFPVPSPVAPRQIVQRSQGGQTRVATLSDADELFPVQFERIPTADVLAARAFFVALNWAARSFTYTDTAGVATIVRRVDEQWNPVQVASGLWNVTMNFYKELF